MKFFSNQLPEPLLLLTLALLGVVMAAVSLYLTLSLSKTIATAAPTDSFDHFIRFNSGQIDKHIDIRIEAFVERHKKEKVAEKFAAYGLAEEHTLTETHIYGNLDARFTLVEYSDLECPYCKRYHPTPKHIVDSSRGLVNWQWKHLPLSFHNPAAAIQAHASECVAAIAGNPAFWVFLHEIFEQTRGNGQGAGDLVDIAQSIGVDHARFTQCINQGEYRHKVAADMETAKSVGLSSTPVTLVIDNHTGENQILKGVQAAETIVSTILRMRKEADASLKLTR